METRLQNRQARRPYARVSKIYSSGGHALQINGMRATPEQRVDEIRAKVFKYLVEKSKGQARLLINDETPNSIDICIERQYDDMPFSWGVKANIRTKNHNSLPKYSIELSLYTVMNSVLSTTPLNSLPENEGKKALRARSKKLETRLVNYILQ